MLRAEAGTRAHIVHPALDDERERVGGELAELAVGDRGDERASVRTGGAADGPPPWLLDEGESTAIVFGLRRLRLR